MAYHIYNSKVLWAQVDANRHVRHSAYADFGAQARVEMLVEAGLDVSLFDELQFGPILFREELKYLREIPMNAEINVHTSLIASKIDGSRWSIWHEIFRADGVLAATIMAEGAWIDLKRRKLMRLNEDLAKKFMSTPRHDDFKEI